MINHKMINHNYKIRYIVPKTGEILKSSKYLKKGIKKSGCAQYSVDGKNWINKASVPEYREYEKNRLSSPRVFFLKMKANIKTKEKKSLGMGKFLIGNNEFEDKKGCCDKLQAHYDAQIERYGPICPITNMEFTFERNNEKIGSGNATRIITNLSNDRLLNEHHYTKQNLLFTSIGWNLNRVNFSIKDMSRLMRKDFFNRYMEILLERFPDKKYLFNGGFEKDGDH
mgnify:FL=1